MVAFSSLIIDSQVFDSITRANGGDHRTRLHFNNLLRLASSFCEEGEVEEHLLLFMEKGSYTTIADNMIRTAKKAGYSNIKTCLIDVATTTTEKGVEWSWVSIALAAAAAKHAGCHIRLICEGISPYVPALQAALQQGCTLDVFYVRPLSTAESRALEGRAGLMLCSLLGINDVSFVDHSMNSMRPGQTLVVCDLPPPPTPRRRRRGGRGGRGGQRQQPQQGQPQGSRCEAWEAVLVIMRSAPFTAAVARRLAQCAAQGRGNPCVSCAEEVDALLRPTLSPRGHRLYRCAAGSTAAGAASPGRRRRDTLALSLAVEDHTVVTVVAKELQRCLRTVTRVGAAVAAAAAWGKVRVLPLPLFQQEMAGLEAPAAVTAAVPSPFRTGAWTGAATGSARTSTSRQQRLNRRDSAAAPVVSTAPAEVLGTAAAQQAFWGRNCGRRAAPAAAAPVAAAAAGRSVVLSRASIQQAGLLLPAAVGGAADEWPELGASSAATTRTGSSVVSGSNGSSNGSSNSRSGSSNNSSRSSWASVHRSGSTAGASWSKKKKQQRTAVATVLRLSEQLRVVGGNSAPQPVRSIRVRMAVLQVSCLNVPNAAAVDAASLQNVVKATLPGASIDCCVTSNNNNLDMVQHCLSSPPPTANSGDTILVLSGDQRAVPAIRQVVDAGWRVVVLSSAGAMCQQLRRVTVPRFTPQLRLQALVLSPEQLLCCTVAGATPQGSGSAAAAATPATAGGGRRSSRNGNSSRRSHAAAAAAAGGGCADRHFTVVTRGKKGYVPQAKYESRRRRHADGAAACQRGRRCSARGRCSNYHPPDEQEFFSNLRHDLTVTASYKTKPCKYHAAGICHYMEVPKNCTHAHGANDIIIHHH